MSQSSDLGVNLTQQRSPCRRQLANQIDQSGHCLPDEAFQRLIAVIDNDSLDFVISAHVIEHLRDPISSVVNAIRVLKVGGIHVLVVPDMRYTFDRNRPETTVEHVLTDFADGGVSTCRNAYEEH